MFYESKRWNGFLLGVFYIIEKSGFSAEGLVFPNWMVMGFFILWKKKEQKRTGNFSDLECSKKCVCFIIGNSFDKEENFKERKNKSIFPKQKFYTK